MFKNQFLQVAVVLTLLAGAAGAEERWATKTVAATWKDGSARLPGVGVVRLTVGEDGDRLLTFRFDKGPYCAATGGKSELLELHCGKSEARFYTVTHAPGGTPEIELVTAGG